MNYISGISNNQKVTVISWSQGGVNTQWSFKYWPSTRSVTNNLVAISPDFHGTVEAFLVCNVADIINSLACTPSIYQQDYNSNFIKTLRADGGDSAYVPTTTIYSGTDEIVEPQQGVIASGFMQDARNVGVTNVQVQDPCANQEADGIYLHEGVMYHPLAYALAVDALTNGGPGNLNRINTQQVCSTSITDGLGVENVIQTEASLLFAAVNIVTFPGRSFKEPALMPYAATTGGIFRKFVA